MNERKTMAEVTTIMENQQSSGLNVRAFCLAENINPATYYYWRKRLRLNENPETPMLVPVSFKNAGRQSGMNQENLELIYPNGVRLSVPQGYEMNLIRELVLIM